MSAHIECWYYSSSGTGYGPVTVMVVHQLIISGQLRPDDTVRHSSWPDWFRVADATGAVVAALPAEQTSVSQADSAAGKHHVGHRGDGSAEAQPANARIRPSAVQPPPPTGPRHGNTPPGAANVPPNPNPTEATDAARAHLGQDDANGSGFDRNAAARPSSPTGAGLFRRVGSWTIDLSVLVGVLAATNEWLGSIPAFASLVIVAFYGFYMIGLPVLRVGTIGHLMFGLRVYDADTGRPAGGAAITSRGLIMVLLALPLLLGIVATLFVAAASTNTRALQDAATNTVVARR